MKKIEDKDIEKPKYYDGKENCLVPIRHCFYKLVSKRDKKTLSKVISKNISKKCLIITDEWCGYTGLQEEGYVHLTVNHSKTFTRTMSKNEVKDMFLSVNEKKLRNNEDDMPNNDSELHDESDDSEESFNSSFDNSEDYICHESDDDNIIIHTNSVEGFWKHLKRNLKNGGRHSDDVVIQLLNEAKQRYSYGHLFGEFIFKKIRISKY